MYVFFLFAYLALNYVNGAPATLGTMHTTVNVAHKETAMNTTGAVLQSATDMVTKIPMQQTTTVPSNEPMLLKRTSSRFPQPYQVQGRAVLANTKEEGSNEWGLTAAQAEIACDRIAKQQGRTPQLSLLDSFMRRLSGNWNWKADNELVGHLLSVGSASQVLALGSLLWPLPRGAYWTGGKLVRHMEKESQNPKQNHRIVLTWSDGRFGSPNVLGMTKEDEEKLQEGTVYCLALDLYSRVWQARDCSDRLPYACLIKPRHVTFSNEALGATTTAPSSVGLQTTTSGSAGTTTTVGPIVTGQVEEVSISSSESTSMSPTVTSIGPEATEVLTAGAEVGAEMQTTPISTTSGTETSEAVLSAGKRNEQMITATLGPSRTGNVAVLLEKTQTTAGMNITNKPLMMKQPVTSEEEAEVEEEDEEKSKHSTKVSTPAPKVEVPKAPKAVVVDDDDDEYDEEFNVAPQRLHMILASMENTRQIRAANVPIDVQQERAIQPGHMTTKIPASVTKQVATSSNF